jgi:hypothetical protein
MSDSWRNAVGIHGIRDIDSLPAKICIDYLYYAYSNEFCKDHTIFIDTELHDTKRRLFCRLRPRRRGARVTWSLALKENRLKTAWWGEYLGLRQRIRIVECGVQQRPLGTAATNRPIVPTPGDYDDGEFGGMMIGTGNRSTRGKPAPCHFVHQKSHMLCPVAKTEKETD